MNKAKGAMQWWSRETHSGLHVSATRPLVEPGRPSGSSFENKYGDALSRGCQFAISDG